MNEGNTKLIKEELDHFIRLAHAQSEQLKQYAELQKRSHALIKTLLRQLNASDAGQS